MGYTTITIGKYRQRVIDDAELDAAQKNFGRWFPSLEKYSGEARKQVEDQIRLMLKLWGTGAHGRYTVASIIRKCEDAGDSLVNIGLYAEGAHIRGSKGEIKVGGKPVVVGATNPVVYWLTQYRKVNQIEGEKKQTREITPKKINKTEETKDTGKDTRKQTKKENETEARKEKTEEKEKTSEETKEKPKEKTPEPKKEEKKEVPSQETETTEKRDEEKEKKKEETNVTDNTKLDLAGLNLTDSEKDNASKLLSAKGDMSGFASFFNSNKSEEDKKIILNLLPSLAGYVLYDSLMPIKLDDALENLLEAMNREDGRAKAEDWLARQKQPLQQKQPLK